MGEERDLGGEGDMSELVVLVNDVVEGMRRVKVMSDGPIPSATRVADMPDGGLKPPRATPALSPNASAAFGERELGFDIPEGAEVKVFQDEIRIWHLEAEWKARGDMVVFEKRFACGAGCPICHGKGCAWRRLVALWGLEKGERIRETVGNAAVEYALRTGNDPAYAWVRSMPKEVKYGDEMKISETVMVNLFSAAWMPERAVAVGRGNGGL